MTHDPAFPTDRPLRILHVLRAPLGGLFRHVVDLTREQIDRGHAVGLVVDSSTGGSRAADVLAELAPRLLLGVMRLPIRRQPHWSDFPTTVRIEAHARALKADVIHGHGSKGGMYARLPAFVPGHRTPIRCYTPHGGSFNYAANSLMHGLFMAAERMMSERTDVLLFESVYIANRFHASVGDTPALVRIVQNGITPAELTPVTPEPDAADFLYVGELRSAKGIDTLIDATAMLSRRLDRKVKVVLVGSGPDELKLTEQARHLGILSQVSFPGAMPARQAFAKGRTIVVPSRAESLPYIVLEAAGARVPMIATNVGGIGEIYGPYRDRLIACDDKFILAAAMERHLAKPARQAAAEADELAAFVSTRFSIANMVDAVLAGYHEGAARRMAPLEEPKRSFALPS